MGSGLGEGPEMVATVIAYIPSQASQAHILSQVRLPFPYPRVAQICTSNIARAYPSSSICSFCGFPWGKGIAAVPTLDVVEASLVPLHCSTGLLLGLGSSSVDWKDPCLKANWCRSMVLKLGSVPIWWVVT